MNRRAIARIALAVVAVVAVVLLYRPLVSWFTGKSMAGKGAAVTTTVGDVDHYTCSMHPSVHQSGPGKCPICGMDLIPVMKGTEGIVTIDEARRQLIGVRTTPVVLAPMHATVRAVGKVAYDETRESDVNLKVRGWIAHLYVNETGQHVTRGQPLFSFYSPDLYNAQQDLLIALRSTASSDAGRSGGFGGAARERLHLLGMSDVEVDAVVKAGAPHENVTMSATTSGFVVEKDVVEGAAVEPGMRLYRIAALDRVWVEADLYETDFAHVEVGQRADVTLDYVPDRAYEAKVAYVYPYLDPKSRTGRVRIELKNDALALRPGMYAEVMLATDLGTRVQVPSSAVIYTGPHRLVFVDLGQGRLQPREVELGSEAGDMIEVKSGVSAGETVAASGVFLIAAEARIRTAAKYWEP